MPGSYQVVEGYLAYGPRPLPSYTTEPVAATGNSTPVRQSKVIFNSRNYTVYGLISIPVECMGKPCPAFVVLPGAGITKEMEHVGLAGYLNEKGYITFALDQKGIGETGGEAVGLTDDYTVYAFGGEAVAHLIIYDALAAYDVLKSIEGIGNVYIAGESAGGRVALVAGALEGGYKGVLGISTSG